MRIQNNMMAMNTQRSLSLSSNQGAKSMAKLSSGFRINSAADDAAGLSISEKMRSQIRGLGQASRNAQDGISLIQTAEGALGETQAILQRMRELAVQAGSDTNTLGDRNEIQKEINQLTSEINRIGNTTEFNTQKLLNGGQGVARTGNLAVAVTDYNNAGTIYTSVDVLDMAGGAATGSVSNLAVATESVKAGTVAISGFNVDTESVVAANAGTIGSPLTEVTRSVGAGTVAINTAEHVAGANAATAFTGDVTAITTTNATDDGNIVTFTVDFASALTGLSENDVTSVSIGGEEYSFEIGATDAASITNLATALKADVGNMTGINAADIVANGTNIEFTASAAETQIEIGAFATVELTDEATVQGEILTGGKAAVYSFEVIENFTAGDAIEFGSLSLVAGTDFAIGDSIADTVSNLQIALQAHADIGDAGAGDYTVTVGSPDWDTDTNSITITANTAGLDANSADFTTGLDVDKTAGDLGEYKFEIATNFEAGQKITVAGQEFTAGDANSATTFAVGADVNETAANIVAAMNLNDNITADFVVELLSAETGFDTDADTILIREKEASGELMDVVIGNPIELVTNQDAVAGQYSIEVTTNFSAGDFIEIAGEKYTAGIEFDVVEGDIEATLDSLIEAINNNGDSNFAASKGDTTFVTGNKLILTEVAASGTDLEVGDITEGNEAAVKGKYEFLITENLGEGDVIKIAGEMLLAGGEGASAGLDGYFAVGDTADDTAANIAAAINGADGDSPQALQDLKALYTASSDGNKVTLEEKVASGIDLVNNATNLSIALNADVRDSEISEVKQAYEFTAQALDAGSVVDIGGTSITLETGGTAAQVATELKAQIEDTENAGTESLREAYDVTVAGDKIKLTQKTASAEDAIGASFSTTDREGFVSKLQIGANTGQSVELSIEDMRSVALKVSGNSSKGGAEVLATDGAVASYVDTVSVTNLSNSLEEFALDVSSYEKATAAISVINDSIETVSGERSKLGSMQNRLEHTIKNLDTSAENMQSAESRIRDVDMAKEMMEFTKNNILQQAATAMLAQANQAPQAVLQLLR